MSLTSRIAMIGALGAVLFMLLVFVAVRGAATAIVNENVDTYLSAYADVLVPAIRVVGGEVQVDTENPVIRSMPRDWQVSLAGTPQVRSHDLLTSLPLAAQPGRFEASDGNRALQVLQRDYVYPDDITVTVSFALEASLVRRFALAQRERISTKMRPVLVIACAVMALLLLAQVIAISLPLRDASRALDRLQRGESPALPATMPRELDALATKINALLARNNETLRRYRQFAANLSHAIKTPLTVLRNGNDNPQALDAIQQIDRLTERHLKRAQIAGPQIAGGQRIDLPALIQRLASAYQKLAPVPIIVMVETGLTLQADADDMTEVFGNLVENAQRFAREQILITVESNRVIVDDDGPGIPADTYTTVLQRGARLDQVAEGSGIGLAVSKEIIELYNGELILTSAPIGGLRVICEIPDLRG